MRKRALYIFLLSLAMLFSGCAYYNTFYNAKKFYKEASKERKKRSRSQIVELSPEEKQLAKKQGISTESEADRPTGSEMQNYQKAIEKASSLLEFYPKSRWVDDALMLLGECFYHRREYSKAQRKFEEIIQLYPRSEFIPAARLLLAKNYIGLEEFDKAEAMFREMAVDDKLPKSIRREAEYELGGLYFEKEEYELAAEAYRTTSRQSDDKLITAMSLYRLGECLVYLKQREEAVSVFKRAVKDSPNEDFRSQATFKLGEAQSSIGDYDAAVRTFSNLLAKELEVKRIPMIKLQLATNLRLKGQINEAMKWYDNIIKDHQRTDASARSYYALAELKEQRESDFEKAKEYYDLVRGEFTTSLVAPAAKERSDNIKLMLELSDGINEILGIKTKRDSLKNKDGKGDEKKDQRDDAPINLTSDGMWMNYAGRDRPPPSTLADMTEEDRLRAQAAQAVTDSLTAGGKMAPAKNDSLLALEKAERSKKDKAFKLAEKQLALGELLMFHFNLPDSAMHLFLRVCEHKIDSTMSARAFYSIAYIMKYIKNDTSTADSVYRSIIALYPQSSHAEGARRELGMQLLADRVDSAAVEFREAEKAMLDAKDATRALALLDEVEKKYPSSPFADKARFASAWLYENILYDYNKALTAYQDLVKNSPKSIYAQRVSAKLTTHERILTELKAKAKEDSIKLAKANSDSAKLANARSDSAKLAAADSLKAGAPADSTQAGKETNLADAPTANAPADSAKAQISPDRQAEVDAALKGANVPETEESIEEAEKRAAERAAARKKVKGPGDKPDPNAPKP